MNREVYIVKYIDTNNLLQVIGIKARNFGDAERYFYHGVSNQCEILSITKESSSHKVTLEQFLRQKGLL